MFPARCSFWLRASREASRDSPLRFVGSLRQRRAGAARGDGNGDSVWPCRVVAEG